MSRNTSLTKEIQQLSISDFERMEEVCVEDYEQRLFNAVEDLLESNKYSILSGETFSNCKVYTKDYFHLTEQCVVEWIINYAEENYGMTYWEREPNAMNLVESFVQQFNEQQTFYTGNKLVGYLDLTEQVERFKNGLKKV